MQGCERSVAVKSEVEILRIKRIERMHQMQDAVSRYAAFFALKRPGYGRPRVQLKGIRLLLCSIVRTALSVVWNRNQFSQNSGLPHQVELGN
jgi:hypothetical protein